MFLFYSSSSYTSARQSSQSPCGWLSTLEDEPSSNLNLEDVELFLQKSGTVAITCEVMLIRSNLVLIEPLFQCL